MAASAGTVLQVTLKGLGENLFFLQICNLYAIQSHISSCSLLLQFARVLIRLWAPVIYGWSLGPFFKGLEYDASSKHTLNELKFFSLP